MLPRLAELPQFGGRHNIANFAWYGLQGGIWNTDGFTVYPAFDDPYGNDVIGPHTQDFGANVVISLIDIFVMHETAQKVMPALWCPWLPIDTDPVPDFFLKCLEGAHLPLTYAKWGHQMLTDAGVKNEYIPHGIEPTHYFVERDRDRMLQFKQALTGLEHSHLSVMVAANKGFPDRKWFQGQLEAWRDFAQDKPEARLYIHTDPTQAHGGVDFGQLVKRLGLDNRVIVPNRYRYRLGYAPEYLRLVYNAADVHLQVSMSEGFGIPLIEAQACGCPVVTTNFSAMPELVRWGHLVDVADRVLVNAHSYQAWPSKRDMTDKLNRLYEAWLICGGDWPISKRLETQDAIHAEYSWDSIVKDRWGPLMARLAEEAPPLDRRFQVQGVDPVADFVGFAQQELKQQAAQDGPRRRVAPLKKPIVYDNEALGDLKDIVAELQLDPKFEANGNGAIHTAYEAVSNEEHL